MPPGRRFSIVVIAVAICGCATLPTSTPPSSSLSVTATELAAHEPGSALAPSLDELNEKLATLKRDSGWQPRGYLTPAEHEDLARLYAAYLHRRQFLLETAGSADSSGEVGEGPYVATLARQCRAEQIDGDSLLVQTFGDDAIAVRKLNEAFYRAGIARGTFDQIRLEVTNPATIRFLQEEMQATKTSPVRLISTANVQHARGASTAQRCSRAHRRIGDLLQQQYPVMPAIANNVRHGRAAQGVVRSGREVHDAWLGARSWIVANVGRIKNPTSRPLQFTPAQKRRIRQAVLPGDVLLTYRAGFASNLFIRGQFKHAIIYVGTVEERLSAGLTAELTGEKLASDGAPLHEEVGQATPFGARQGDVVESLAEGVVFNKLDDILDQGVNRMVVLRPALRADQRRDALLTVFSFVGDAYDFHFDFADASDQVCTELFYRAYNGKGNIQLHLTRRFGRQTLNADDIIRHYLGSSPEAFELVLLVDQVPSPDDRMAQVLFGSAAHDSLASLMDR